MTLSNSIFAVSGAATFLDARKDMSNLFACDTSLEPHPGLLTVGGNSAANGNVVVGMSNRMAVTVRPFQAVLNRLGALLIMNDGDVVVSLKAAPSANSRIDVVYVKQREKRAPISDSEDGPIIGVVTGTANLTPVAPQVPDGAVALAQVKVPSGVTNTTASGVVITQVYPYAATRGEELRFRSKDEMNAFAALDGTKAVTLSDNAHYVRTGGAWDSGKMKASVILSSIFQELDPLNVRRNGNILQVGGSVKMVKSWNPSADDHVLRMPKGIKFDGYQQNFTLCTNDRTLRMAASDNTDYIRFNSSGSVGDWAVGTYFYAQSTWIIKD